MNVEVPKLLAAAEADGVRMLWACLSPCLVEDTTIHEYQAILPPNQYLAGRDPIGELEALKTIARSIQAAVAEDLPVLAPAAPPGSAGAAGPQGPCELRRCD